MLLPGCLYPAGEFEVVLDVEGDLLKTFKHDARPITDDEEFVCCLDAVAQLRRYDNLAFGADLSDSELYRESPW